MKKQEKKIRASEFDRVFEEGSVAEHLDLQTLKADFPVHRVNIDIPRQILEKVDREASRVGVTRTSLLKLWIAGHADKISL